MITYSEAPAGGGGGIAVMISESAPSVLTATVNGGTAPYTYNWVKSQNKENIHNTVAGMVQTGTPNMTGEQLTITSTPPDGFGSAVMWRCEVTDSLGKKGVGYYIFIIQT